VARWQRMSKRVRLNREVVDAAVLGYADGLQAVGERVIERAVVPDAPPYGVGLVDTGRATTYVMGKRVAGGGTPPRGSILQRGITTIIGWGFPGRFQERGTSRQPPRPFATPAIVGTIPDAPAIVAPAVQARVDRVRS